MGAPIQTSFNSFEKGRAAKTYRTAARPNSGGETGLNRSRQEYNRPPERMQPQTFVRCASWAGVYSRPAGEVQVKRGKAYGLVHRGLNDGGEGEALPSPRSLNLKPPNVFSYFGSFIRK